MDREKHQKKRNKSTIILILVFLVGLGVLLYPGFSNWWNSRVQSRAIVDYEAALAQLTPQDYTAEFEKADAYNSALRALAAPLSDYAQAPGYADAVNVSGSGMMGYITIPRISVKLPIYHGTSDAVLAGAAGHLEGTSLPVGGESTHAVISAHRGLPSAKLFTNLDALKEGDTFTIKILDRTLTYQVDQIRIVEPDDLSELSVVEGQDYVTLLTCTPYGINTHRLLVRGVRIDNADGPTFTSEAYELDSAMLTPIVAAPLLLILLIILLVKYRRKRR